jgi:FAD:protein FMN transferase
MEAAEASKRLFQRNNKHMGNRFNFSVVAHDALWAGQCLDAAEKEVQRIESLLTTFSDQSQTARINEAAGIAPVAVDEEVVQLVLRAQKISALTQGAFDLSYGSIDKSLWNFDTSMTALPDAQLARQSVQKINYRNIIVDAKANTVFLKEKGMRIGFGGIGKGYAADRAKQVLVNMGVKDGVVNAAGDLVTWGNAPSGKPWTIGIADPNTRNIAFSQLSIPNLAIATSGNYEKFAIIDGKKYGHTIDPKTGLPVTGIKSVSIICPSAELADAMATPVMVMGIKAGLFLLNQLKSMACIVVDEKDQLHTTKNIKLKP